ncbi:MMPL family transporter [Butyrivibrio sp. YAB3001]|uniref:MMPL family transporter n=1 Tax=Butyrivibrio sp. YAB3001 TaxID=1520812 RepID=UPI0008F66B61|nr:MMPL family transporter [Butyrivibrio sp. YAB3001]SFB69630.1 Predicted exporter protein, RND superfamily [Butyrivibrio sp. YAB3001]
MDTKEEKGVNNVMLKICAFIVDKRNLFFLIYTILCIFSVISRNWVSVENQLAKYLPATSETRLGLDIMDEQFTTYGSVKVMVANLPYDRALIIKDELEAMDGVFSAEVDDTDKHYNNGSALFNITFDYDEKDEQCLVLLDQVKEYFKNYDYYLSTTLGDIQSELINKEMSVISIIVVIVVVAVLIFTSQAYAEVPVLLLTFGSAALLQIGTNFLLGTISFVSDSVTIVLQLALSVDYAVIFLNRYKEEHEILDFREACIIALSKSIPEISGSSLTTIGGLVAMLFMQFGIGRDMGIVLIKAIILSLLSVFLLMPGIIMLFANLMEKTKHKNFIPQIPFVGKFAYATRFIIAPAFVIVIILANRISSKTPYVYGYSQITPPLINEVQKAQNLQDENFRSDNMVALVFPSGDYEKEKHLIEDLMAEGKISSITGLANTEALNGYTLTEKLTPRQFSELLNIDYEVAELIYTAFAVNDADYAKVVNGLASYKVPLIDMFMFVYKEVKEGYVTLDDELMKKLDDANRMMNFAKKQLQGEDFSRMIVYLNLPQESDETFSYIEHMHTVAEKYYDADKIYVVGESVSQYDLKKCFGRDNTVTSVISILAVLVVLLFSFKSAGMPVLLIAVIQGCIWINFSVPAIEHDNLFFLGYLIVSSIQMGANIDYAIVIAGRYTELRSTMGKRDAIINTMNLSFPTIITSGTMLAVAGTLIGKMTSDCAIYGIGKCLGRGTIISILITMFVLPQILLVGDKVIELSAFVMNMPIQTKQKSGSMRIDGMVRGHIDGNITGVVHAVVKGNISAYVENGDIQMIEDSEGENI